MPFTPSPQLWAYLAGCTTVLFIWPLLRYMMGSTTKEEKKNDKIYNLHHSILNLELPPKTMWMNMGYWDHDCIEFPQACTALLSEVLKSAGFSTRTSEKHILAADTVPIKLIDVGIGCGDQTQYLMRTNHHHHHRPKKISSYTGITNDRTQFEYAQRTLSSLRIVDGEDDVRIFCADAACPAGWSRALREATEALAGSSGEEQATWLLALDTLYHFSPSRQLLFDHAYRGLRASVMAFDLLLADETSVLQRVLLSVLALLVGCPVGNFCTVARYRAQLVAAGYEERRIEIRDVSGHVFAGLAGFIERRDKEMEMFVGRGVGPYRVFGRVLRWWASSGVVRGCIVVARR